ncbi:MAG: MATE family efflux transporter [Rhodobacter sp.]|nr:MATE family efflux transporter [Rhodobacter sp.]
MNLIESYRLHARALLILGLPLIGSHLAQILIGVTDALMLGWYDIAALAAVTLGHSVYFVFFIVGSGFAFAVLPMVASAVAEGDTAQVRRVTRMGLWLSGLYGVLVLPPLIWSEPLMLALGQEPETAALAQQYLQIASFGVIPALLVMVLKNYLAALERTQAVLWITVSAAVLNAALNYVLIFGRLGFPEMGLAGAAIASVLIQLASLLLLMAHIARVTPEHALFQRLWRRDGEAFARVFRLGWPIGLTNLAESGLFSASALMMGWLGAQTLAAHGIALQLASMTFVVHLGLSQAATVRVGYAAGRKDGPGLRQGAKVAVAMSALFAGVTILIYLTLPEVLVGLFVDPADPQRPAILAIGVTLLAVAALFQLVDGAQVVSLGLLRGLHDTRVPMIYAAISYWGVGIPSSYAMGFVIGWGGVGVWLGLVVGLALAAGLLLTRFWRQARHRYQPADLALQ